MKVTWSWLRDWVELPAEPEELAGILASRGFPVQSLERGTSFDPEIVVGHVLEVSPHPNADRLRLCTVDIGSARLSVVCGAPNVAAGQRIALAKIGSKLPDGTKLRKSKIRGVESEGMICSERELGRSEESQGIWVLPGEPAIGVPLAEAVGGSDTILDVEVTSNRTDCDAVIGLAREIASARRTALREAPKLEAKGAGKLPGVSIEDPRDCPRYMARVVRGVKVGPAPDWLRRRLEATGFRSINNVVDATNYVLREYGQPIHAFDAAKVGGYEIRVRRARAGERLTLLDGRDVALAPAHLVIADASKAMALAGVMGGIESGVTDVTTDVVLESAQFDAKLTQETARSLGIASDAAARFAQGVDPDGVARALDAVARLLAETAEGTVLSDVADQWPGRAEPGTVALRHRRLTSLLGVEMEPSVATDALATLGIPAVSSWSPRNGDLVATFGVPSFRKDLEIEEDLIEEVGRVVGYDAIPLRVRAMPVPPRSLEPQPERVADRIVEVALGLGFHEALSTVLVGEIPPEAREAIPDGEIWELQNPMSRELKHLRVGLLPGLLASAVRNLHQGVRDVRLVEAGKVFRAVPPPIGSERHEAALLVAGLPDEWDRPGAETDRLLELKGAVEALLEALGIDSCGTTTYHGAHWKHGTGARILATGDSVAEIGEIAPSLAERLGLDQPAWAAVLDVASIGKAAPGVRKYADIPRFPASKRDLAVVVPREAHHGELMRTIREAGGPFLSGVRLFDVFEGRAIGEGRKSMAYALEFRSPDRTLSDRDVDGAIEAIVHALTTKFGAALRGSPAGPGTRP
ncbi:MAG TPA: phenylalanine--tRNA ligase subunit beta [Candidatus Eisenbacteria bacterium]|nr:phenylalanine--tRNA ligase subunit beta [Candidatus Eisenbacteria bacterium]